MTISENLPGEIAPAAGAVSNNAQMTALFLAIADVLDEGNEPIAAKGAAAIRRLAPMAVTSVPETTTGFDEVKAILTREDAHPVCATLAPVFGSLNWYHSGLESGKIRADVSLRMLTCELVGPTGIVFEDSCRVGLFAQGSGLDYPERTHAAEELFVMLAGTGHWRQSGAAGGLRGTGARMHHASYEPHASATLGDPLLAIWVWTGELTMDSYQLRG